MGRLRAKQDYESLRNARIAQIKARMESIGIKSSAGEIPAIISSAKSIKRVTRSVSDSASPLRRSDRLKGKSCGGSSSPQDSCKSEGETKTETFACESLENAGKSEEKATMASAGDERNTGEIQIISSSTKRIKQLKPSFVTTCRRSDRLKGKSYDFECTSSIEEIEDGSELVQERPADTCKREGMETTDDSVSGISDYERLRLARINENKARMASLGLDRSIKELQDIISSGESNAATKRKYNKVKPDLSTPCRRSDRLKGKPGDLDCVSPQASSVERDEPSVTARRRLFSDSDRCGSKGRGSIYDPLFGICCHFCRQKKLCGEEECRRCGDRDINQPCIGKTECSACHSSNGVLCRACLKVRYGEEMEAVRKNKDWMCPHCIEKKRIKPYWICNSSLCLKKRRMAPTGIAIYQAREQGYQSVAHLIMDKLKRKGGF